MFATRRARAALRRHSCFCETRESQVSVPRSTSTKRAEQVRPILKALLARQLRFLRWLVAFEKLEGEAPCDSAGDRRGLLRMLLARESLPPGDEEARVEPRERFALLRYLFVPERLESTPDDVQARRAPGFLRSLLARERLGAPDSVGATSDEKRDNTDSQDPR